MSYDLYFYLPPELVPSKEKLLNYFSRRVNYTVGGHQADYENPDTDVHFSFSFPEVERREGEESEAGRFAHFNINYFRPHIFGLEAEPELDAFMRAFKPRLMDPQNEGMGEGPYSREGFLRGWNSGNR